MRTRIVFVLLVCITGCDGFFQSTEQPGTNLDNVVKELKSDLKEMKSKMNKYAKEEESFAKAMEKLRETSEELKTLKAHEKILDGPQPDFASLEKQLHGLKRAMMLHDINLRRQEEKLQTRQLISQSQNGPLTFLLKKSKNKMSLKERADAYRLLEDAARKEDPVKEDPVKEDPIREDPVKEEPENADPVKEDPVKEDPVKEDPKKEDHLKEVCNKAAAKDYIYDENAHFCYKFVANKTTWGDAVEICKDDGGNLAKVDTERKIDIVSKFSKRVYTSCCPMKSQTVDINLGATDEEEDGVWRWIVDNTIVENFDMQGHKTCLEMHKGKFDDSGCRSGQHYICELREPELN